MAIITSLAINDDDTKIDDPFIMSMDHQPMYPHNGKQGVDGQVRKDDEKKEGDLEMEMDMEVEMEMAAVDVRMAA
ncbi:hypothetical protein BLA29_001850 [Euroglyphus maynei]|uniref:Uncharacterized protein n=1 Tax=Euroglyphus maynei TaxID=6958 RepID=A0A1Y3B8L3_EURMA|nr:hypothetical protein BLA29_001850 [Euroglyphus maynei]